MQQDTLNIFCIYSLTFYNPKPILVDEFRGDGHRTGSCSLDRSIEL